MVAPSLSWGNYANPNRKCSGWHERLARVTSSGVDRALVYREGGFFHDLRERGVAVEAAGEVFATGGEFDGDDGFGDQVRGVRAEDVDAEEAIGFGIADDFDKAI